MVQDDFFVKTHENFEKTHSSQILRSWNKVFVKSPILKWEGLNYLFNKGGGNTRISSDKLKVAVLFKMFPRGQGMLTNRSVLDLEEVRGGGILLRASPAILKL